MTNQPQQGGYGTPRQTPRQPINQNRGVAEIPNSTTVLVIGILSIAGCWFYGIISFVLAIIGLSMGAKGKKLYLENPGYYLESSYKNLKAGHTMSIIGLILSSFWLVFIIIYIAIIIFAVSGSGILDELDFTNMMIIGR